MPNAVDEFLKKHGLGGADASDPAGDFLAQHYAAGHASSGYTRLKSEPLQAALEDSERAHSDPLWRDLDDKWEKHVAERSSAVATSGGRLVRYKPDPKAWVTNVLADAIKSGAGTTTTEIGKAMEWAGDVQSGIDRARETNASMAAIPQTPEARARAAIASKPFYYKLALQAYNAYQSAAEALPYSMNIAEALNPGAAEASAKLKAALSDVEPVATALTGAFGSGVGSIAGIEGAGVVPFSIVKGAEPHVFGSPTETGLREPDTTLVGDVGRELLNNLLLKGVLSASGAVGKGVAEATAEMNEVAANVLEKGARAATGAAIQAVMPRATPEGFSVDALEWQEHPDKAAARLLGNALAFLFGAGGPNGESVAPEGSQATPEASNAESESVAPPGSQPGLDARSGGTSATPSGAPSGEGKALSPEGTRAEPVEAAENPSRPEFGMEEPDGNVAPEASSFGMKSPKVGCECPKAEGERRQPSVERAVQKAREIADVARSNGGTGGASGLDTSDGTFGGRSTNAGGRGDTIHPEVQKALEGIPEEQQSIYHGKCAEVRAISDALYAGVDVRGAIMVTVRVGGDGHGTVMTPCKNSCNLLLKHFGIIDGGE